MLNRVAGIMVAASALLMAQGQMARPGTVNYAEGQVSLNGRLIGASEIGKAEAAPGQVLETGAGKAEMLLTPGVFLRLSDQSAVRMVAPSLIDTRVELLRGEAMVEADMLAPGNRIAIVDGGSSAVIAKRGIYKFQFGQVAVFDGELQVLRNDRTINVGKGKQLLLGQDKTQKFDRDTAEATDALYSWSRLRSEYVAEANMSMAQTFVVGGPAWYGMGWYWNPYFDSWAFMPGYGFLYSPFGFGWGFYSPAYWRVYAPYGVGYRGFVGRSGFVAPAIRMGGFGGAHFGGGRR